MSKIQGSPAGRVGLLAFLRARLRRTPSPPRADRLAIAVLEHDVYGTQPQPGSAASFALNLRAFANTGVSTSEMMHRMTDCADTGTITLDGHAVTVICNLPPGHSGAHHDLVHGDWARTPE